jgi:4'-phosphopantetheinyl transferase
MANPTEWLPAPETLILAPTELHLWRARRDEGSEPLQRCQELLSPDEKERARRFAIDGARRDFIVSRGILRELLAGYLNTRPSDIVLSYGIHGKPYVSLGETECDVHFNVSHSKGFAVFAFCLHAEVGVDVEWIRAEFPGREIAERFFSGREVAALGKLAPERSSAAFFTCWTRKEAYVKARGGGLQIPLRSFSVGLEENEEQQLVDEAGKEWSVYPVEPDAGFAAAVAVEGKDWRLKCWERRLKGSGVVRGEG